jgi:hypothetical protein
VLVPFCSAITIWLSERTEFVVCLDGFDESELADDVDEVEVDNMGLVPFDSDALRIVVLTVDDVLSV